uniref:Uncharacterized protein n=1 Tax=Pipistrellus kuhlii TaxID=59472 RepID=A0A7J7R9E7_PIPKU|nr:hypothetical protein mPipKuh1_010819 [Pipistrellus kuhlii]
MGRGDQSPVALGQGAVTSRQLPGGGNDGQRCCENVGCLPSSLSRPLLHLPWKPGLACWGSSCPQVPGTHKEPTPHPHSLCLVSRCSCLDGRGRLGSPWVHAGTSLRGQLGECVLAVQLPCGAAGQPRGPCCAPACSVWPRSLHLCVGTQAL